MFSTLSTLDIVQYVGIVVIFLGSAAGILCGDRCFAKCTHFELLSNSFQAFSGGILFGLALFHLLGDSFECFGNLSYKIAPFAWFAFGFIIMLLLSHKHKHNSSQEVDGQLELKEVKVVEVENDIDEVDLDDEAKLRDDEAPSEDSSLIESKSQSAETFVLRPRFSCFDLPSEITVELSIIFHSIIIGYFMYLEEQIIQQVIMIGVLTTHQYFEGNALLLLFYNCMLKLGFLFLFDFYSYFVASLQVLPSTTFSIVILRPPGLKFSRDSFAWASPCLLLFGF